jgi:hypothetical protein
MQIRGMDGFADRIAVKRLVGLLPDEPVFYSYLSGREINAAFFAIYHPPISWLPVAVVGLFNGVLFKMTGRLGPCIAAHMIYNAAVVLI